MAISLALGFSTTSVTAGRQVTLPDIDGGLLTESGDYLLTEAGEFLVLEDGRPPLEPDEFLMRMENGVGLLLTEEGYFLIWN